MAATLLLLYQTAKVRLGFLIMACALAGVAVSSGHPLSGWQIAALGFATLVASSAAGAFNQYYERDLDGRMRRTAGRPFVTGRFEADWPWLAAILLALTMSVVLAAFATNWLAALYVFLGAFTYGVVYTVWLKRRTWMNIVIGGLAGSFAVLAGAAAAGDGLGPAPLILAGVLFLWTPPHFWALALACRDDYRAAGVPMLPVVIGARATARTILAHAVVMVGLSLLPAMFGMGIIYLVGAVLGGGFFIVACLRLSATPETPQAWRAFAASIVQLGVLLSAAMLDRLILG